MKKTVKLIICATLVFVFALAFTGCGKTKVNFEDYISVEFNGYDTRGIVSLEVNNDAIDDLVEQKKIEKYIGKLPNGEQLLMWTGNIRLSQFFNIKLKDTYQDLSNGDKIVVEIEIVKDLEYMGVTFESLQKGLKIKIPQTEMEFTVNGLEEAKILDLITPVEDLIQYSGANGSGTAMVNIPNDFQRQVGDLILVNGFYSDEIKIIKNNTEIGEISYNFKKDTSSNLSGGDRIELHCKADTSTDMSQIGYDLILDKKEIVVPDLGEYVTSKDMLTDELKEQIINTLDASYPETTNRSFFWGTLKPTAASDNVARDCAKLFGYVQYPGFFSTVTLRCEFEIIKKADNTYSIDWQQYEIYSVERLHNADYDVEDITFN